MSAGIKYTHFSTKCRLDPHVKFDMFEILNTFQSHWKHRHKPGKACASSKTTSQGTAPCTLCKTGANIQNFNKFIGLKLKSQAKNNSKKDHID